MVASLVQTSSRGWAQHNFEVMTHQSGARFKALDGPVLTVVSGLVCIIFPSKSYYNNKTRIKSSSNFKCDCKDLEVDNHVWVVVEADVQGLGGGHHLVTVQVVLGLCE